MYLWHVLAISKATGTCSAQNECRSFQNRSIACRPEVAFAVITNVTLDSSEKR
jgi:hypothetical protein